MTSVSQGHGVRSTSMRAVVAQTRAELTMTARRGESVLVTLIMPVFFLLFFGSLFVVPSVAGKPVNFLFPGVLAIAVMSTGMVSLGIATAYERYYGVLKRLGSAPLPRWALLVAKGLSVLALELVQTVLLVILAIVVYGWRPAATAWLALPVILLGTATFAGLGMLMAGALRAEATLAGANGLYVVFLAIGGVVLPVDHLPPFLQALANALPPAALSSSLRAVLNGASVSPVSIAILAGWAVVFGVAAATTFKWE